MGRQSTIKRQRSGDIIHRSTLFGGTTTAEEVHRRLSWRGRCTMCGGAPVIKIRCFMLVDDIVDKSPEYLGAAMMTNPGGAFKPDGTPNIPTVTTKFGEMVLFASALACRDHQRELERTAAKHKSNVLVEIDRGPGADKATVHVDNRNSVITNA